MPVDKKYRNRHLLIDGDVICYAATSVSNYEVDWGEEDGGPTNSGNLRLAQDAFQSSLSSLLEELGTTDFTLCWSHGKNFRKEILPSYKAPRKLKAKPHDYYECAAWARETYASKWIDTLEGDDVMGILMDEDHIMVSIDKDMFTIPGKFYRMKTGNKYQKAKAGPVQIVDSTEVQAQRFFLTQVVTGDTSDNYTGVPGVGPARAEKWFQEYGYNWRAVVSLYKTKDLREEDAIIQAQMARILTKKEWNDGVLTMWDPSHLIKE